MTTTRVVIIGAGGFGREVLDVLRDWADGEALTGHKVEFLGFIDDKEPRMDRLARLGAEWLGPLDTLKRMPGVRYALGIGDGATRQRIDEYIALLGAGIEPITLIHSTASIGADAHIGPGAVICAGVRITTNVHIARHVHLNLNCTVGHDATLSNYVTVNPLVAVSGGVILGPGVMLGTGSVVNQDLEIHARAKIGSGAAVTKTIPPDITAVGVPARPLRPAPDSRDASENRQTASH